jgi:glutathione S-transferase
MKLYYSRGACSLSPHIVLREAGLPFELVAVDLKTKTIAGGADYRSVNPKGYVPLLELDDGSRLTEGPAIVQYLADHAPHMNLAPANGTFARYQLQEWLNFISTEIHKQFSPLFDPTASEDVKTKQRDKLASRFDWLQSRVGDQNYLMGQQFTVADAYLFTVLNWSRAMDIDLGRWPRLKDYLGRVAQRPAVQEALQAEGLRK